MNENLLFNTYIDGNGGMWHLCKYRGPGWNKVVGYNNKFRCTGCYRVFHKNLTFTLKMKEFNRVRKS